MKMTKFFIFIFLFIISSPSVLGQTDIHFDISKGNVRLTDNSYSGKNSAGTEITGTHNPDNKYIISGATTQYNVQIGSTDALASSNFIIYLNGVSIKRNSSNICSFSVWNKDKSVVAVILKNNSKNILYSGKNRAGLEKSGGKDAVGTLLITCEAGYEAWKKNPTQGHTNTGSNYNESACTETCGHLDARSGNTWNNTNDETYNKGSQTYSAGAGIGTSGQGSGGANLPNHRSGSNALVNLTIAGGNIQARGAWGYSSGTSGGAAAIGTGSTGAQEETGGTITGLNITGGNIKAYRVDNSAACIGGGYRSGYVNMNIYGGTIDASLTDALEDNLNGSARLFDRMRAAAIGGGGGGNNTGSPAGATVIIHNGYIKAKGQYGAAIGSGSGGNKGYGQYAEVIIKKGYINASTEKGLGEGSGAAIGSGGSTGTGHAGEAVITIEGGEIIASSELGADIGGGGTNSSQPGGYGGKSNITITGGTIRAESGGIGGGRANVDKGGDANITISGNNTKITAESIGGGRSKKNLGGNVELTVNGGSLNVTDYIGGGIGVDSDNIGWAKVYINGGTITGRIIMKASVTDGCIFEMNDGILSSAISDQPGGAVYMDDPNGIATLRGGTIQNCQGTIGGAVYMSGGKFTISGNGVMKNNTATQNGAAVYLDGSGEVYVKGGKITGIADKNFEAIYMAGGKFTMSGGTIEDFKGSNSGAVYMEAGEFTMTNGLIDNCNGTDGGAIYMSGGSFDISGGTISNCKGATNGGAVYLGGTGTVNVNGGNITGNSVENNGGAIYMVGGNFSMNNGNISQCTGKDGGAVYMTGGTFTISGNAVILNNSSTNGGAVYLAGDGILNVNGGTLKGNKVTNHGGAIYLTDGTFNMNAGKVEGNKSSGGNGSGIYINNGTVTLQGGEVTGNITTAGKGGGFYVGGGTVTLSNGKIASNKASLAGGGICLEGKDENHKVTVAVNGCTLTANEATDGNGGGIFLSNAEMTYNGGMLTSNSATGTGLFTTGYKVEAEKEKIKGVGGGIYISSNSKLSFGDFSTLGVYANSAENAADDIFANGKNTELLVPNITYMKLQDYAGNADGLGWYEDYFINDSSYGNTDIAKGEKGNTPFTERFKEAQEKGFDFMRLYDIKEESITLKNTYIAFALGFLFSDLTIRVEGLNPGETCIFTVQGTAESGKYKYQIPIFGTSNLYDEKKIIRLPIDKYTVTLKDGWSWAYDKNECEPNNGTITEKNSVNGGIYKFTMKHRETSITHDEKRIRESLE